MRSVFIFCLLFLSPGIVIATPPCPPDYSKLCLELGGKWKKLGGKCDSFGSCSIPIPIVELECQTDSDCKPCGENSCKPDLGQFSSATLEALKRERSLGFEDYYASCLPHFNQTCACVNGRCILKERSVECRKDSDCFYCCGSCKATYWKQVADCESSCILDKSAEFNCGCLKNKCRPFQ